MPPIWPDPIDDDQGTRYRTFLAAGRSLQDLTILGQRYDAEVGFRWDESESWLVRVSASGVTDPPTVTRMVLGGTAWLTRVWTSPAGHFWVSSMAGEIYEETTTGGGYRTHPLPALPSGVWGLDDRCVYAWSESQDRLYRWDGARWIEMPCPGSLLVMTGTAPDDLIAGGYDGSLWRWDGQTWTPAAIGFRGGVCGLALAGPDQAWACTTEGDVVEITRFGVQRLARWEGPLLDVTVIGDDVYLAGGASGLLRVSAGTNVIEGVTDDFGPERFDKRADGRVIISAGRGVLETTDGQSFTPGPSADYLRERRETYPPMWEA
jgi:hypothetical protein